MLYETDGLNNYLLLGPFNFTLTWASYRTWTRSKTRVWVYTRGLNFRTQVHTKPEVWRGLWNMVSHAGVRFMIF